MGSVGGWGVEGLLGEEGVDVEPEADGAFEVLLAFDADGFLGVGLVGLEPLGPFPPRAGPFGTRTCWEDWLPTVLTCSGLKRLLTGSGMGEKSSSKRSSAPRV